MMRAMFLGALLGGSAAVGIYFYFYFKRVISWWRKKPADRTAGLWAAALGAVSAFKVFQVWNTWAMVVMHLFGFALCLDLVNALIRLTKRGGRRWERVYRCGLVPFLCTALLMGYGYWNIHRVVRTDYRVETEKPIRAQGYRIALVSDLHFGTTMDGRDLAGYAGEIEAAGPDLLVLCGDIVDEATTREEMEEAMAVLGAVKCPLGVYFVRGNHDRASYTRTPNFTAEELERAIRGAGITILTDRRVQAAEDLTLIGRDDRSRPVDGRRRGLEELLDGADRSSFLLLLDHQPSELEAADRAGYDLLLSGHTHAGQIWPTGLISQAVGIVELNYGQRKLDHLQVIVSSGIGGWGYPIRTSRHCEYVIISVEGNKAE